MSKLRFSKAKAPKPLKFGSGVVEIDAESCAKLKLGYVAFGPRDAIKLAKWLIRYSKWSSLQ